ncbi:ankyrin repeat-containing domain protein, partial [Thelonectria olida]
AKELRLLQSLYLMHYQDRKDRNPKPVAGTCQWFTTHKLFRKWLKVKESNLLWLSADPGCGKSVLARYLVDKVLPSTDSRTTCYFFFKDDFVDQKSPAVALCCILRQILDHKRSLILDEMLRKFEADGKQIQNSFHDLWSILIGITRDPNAGDIICILDALDECEETGRSQILRALCDLSSHRNTNSSLRFILTSRPYLHIQREFQALEDHLLIIHLSGENEVEADKISREIDLVVRHRVHDLATKLNLRPDERQILRDGLTRVPNRTYLWVHLICEVVRNIVGCTPSSLKKQLEEIPKTVDEAYESILARSPNPKKAAIILHIIVAAARPLSLGEMALVLAINENHGVSHDLELEPEDRFRITIRELCGLFVAVVDSKIYLLHQTAREFLVCEKGLDPSSPLERPDTSSRWKWSLRPGDSNRMLAEVCIWYILFIGEAYPIGPAKDLTRLDRETLLQQYTNKHIFFEYSAKQWATHVRSAEIADEETMRPLLMRICDTQWQGFMPWFGICWSEKASLYWHSSPEDFTTLMVASFCGVLEVVRQLLKASDTKLHATSPSDNRSALSWAAERGHVDVVKLLLDKKARGKGGLVGRLFSRSADVNIRDWQGRSPLSLAAQNGHEGVVKLFLATGKVDTDIKGHGSLYQESLSFAAENGHKDVFKLLVAATDSNSNAWGRFGCTVMRSAIVKRKVEMVKLLLDIGKVNVNAKKEDGYTVIMWAIQWGDIGIVKLLLDTGKVNVNAKDKLGDTVIMQAIAKGNLGIVELLLDTGKVDLHAKGRNGWTVLSYANTFSGKEVSKLLRSYL